MNFPLEIEKTKAALLYICKAMGGECDKYNLLKMLYFAEKEHIARYGRPITGESYYALDYGPVPSYSYDATKGTNTMSEVFEFKENNNIQARFEPDMDELSESDIICLDNSVKENKDLSFKEIKDKSHDKAYKVAPFRGLMSTLEIALASGASDDMIDYIKMLSENNNCLLDVPDR
jgi:uncharacterized phage-associated protein